MATQVASIRRLQQLRQALPELVLIPTHDHTAYRFDHLVPFLADGTLSPEERQWLDDYHGRVLEVVAVRRVVLVGRLVRCRQIRIPRAR